jgi:tRNA dimethylallyltransferase
VGPTGVGKTQVGLSLSRFLPLEFISADSMQIYKGMDIITDKLPKPYLRKYPHHLIDMIDPERDYSVADYCKVARKAIAAILKKKKTPVVIGGTGLYINSLLYGIFEGPGKNESIRRRLESEIKEKGARSLFERLNDVDPEAAAKINENDARRIVRALEVYEITKKPISALQKEKKGLLNEYEIHLFGLRRERSDLYNRIEQRVDFMINAGLLAEVQKLLRKKLSKTAYFCIGVRETEGCLKGEYDLAEAINLIKRNSRRFAKRQMTWFNKNKDIEWIDLKESEDMDKVAQMIARKIKD